jgi:cation transport ATPase
VQSDFESIVLQVKNYIPPECTCKVEDMVNALPHVIESSFDPINGILKVKIHKGMTSTKEIAGGLEKCRVQCEQTQLMTKSSMGHMDHEAMNMTMKTEVKKPVIHDHHAKMEAKVKRSFIVAAIFTIPVLILSPSIQAWIGYTLPQSFALSVILAVSASIVILYGGLVFYKGSIQSFKMHTLDMNVLVSIALLSGYLYSLAATFLFKAPDFYWEISTLATFILFGHWMEMRAQRNASGALRELVK